MLTRIDRYIARLIIVPMVSTLTICAMLLLLEKMLSLFDFVINEGGPVNVVFQMLANLVPSYLGLGIPVGVLLGTLLAFRRLALNSELDALTSSGMSWLRLLKMPYLIAAFMALLTFLLVGYVRPYTNYAYDSLRFDLRSGALGASIKVGEFVDFGKGLTLRIDQSAGGGQDLAGIFVRKQLGKGDIVITAARGTFLRTDDPDVILFRLSDGMIIQSDPALASPRQLSFKVHDLPIDLPIISAFRKRGGAEQELTIFELVRASNGGVTDAALQRKAEANFWRRMIEISVLFLLPPLGVAFAVPPKRNTSAIGVFASVVLLVSYHKISESLEKTSGLQESVSPFLAQFGPFLLFGLFNFAMFAILAFRVGGQPLGVFGFLGRPFKKIGALWRLLMRKFFPPRRVELA
jgi:lipopolysaccharide export system permease protein